MTRTLSARELRQQVERLRDKAVALEKSTSRGAKLRHEGAAQMAAAVLALMDRAAPGQAGPPESRDEQPREAREMREAHDANEGSEFDEDDLDDDVIDLATGKRVP